MTDHVPLACPYTRDGVEGFQAKCVCPWEGPSFDGRTEARTRARMAAEDHVVREEAKEAAA